MKRIVRPNPDLSACLALATMCALSLAGYLLASMNLYRPGFPLDDAWIHQTYARNLAWRQEWAFLPGQPSAGSTSPLWTFLLAVGYLLHIEPRIYAYLLGWLCLSALSLAAYRIMLRSFPTSPAWAFGVGVFMAFEWRLVWAAGSGMETLLFGLMAFVFTLWIEKDRIHPFWIGLGAGASIWLRPDGLTLLGPALWAMAFNQARRSKQAQQFSRLLLGFACAFAPYLAFNFFIGGSLWPNTYHAKQAEYEILRSSPFWLRLAKEASLPLIGAGALLLPGFNYYVYGAIRNREWYKLGPVIWVLGMIGLYAWRLPVVYQHGRYILPVMPVFFLLGILGATSWIKTAPASMFGRVVRRAWVLSCLAVLAVFYLLGAQAYARDTAIIESEMVDTAKWVAQNTEQNALVAAHDIGALGYFGGRTLVDLAGLASPDVIPFIRDEGRLAAYLDERGVSYLVTFPGWYPKLVQRGELIYTSQGVFSPTAGGENMQVYRWFSP